MPAGRRIRQCPGEKEKGTHPSNSLISSLALRTWQPQYSCPISAFTRKDEEKPRSVQADRETHIKDNGDAGYNIRIEIFLANRVFPG